MTGLTFHLAYEKDAYAKQLIENTTIMAPARIALFHKLRVYIQVTSYTL